ncbi:MAG: hypothetical protein Q9180_006818, partial [Flavoplaca navasiana]
TIQKRIPGESLNKLWATLDSAEKYAIVDELIVLIAKLESITFATAGTLHVSSPLPERANNFLKTEDPWVQILDEYPTELTKDPKMV